MRPPRPQQAQTPFLKRWPREKRLLRAWQHTTLAQYLDKQAESTLLAAKGLDAQRVLYRKMYGGV
jgi:hypothetical protein